MKGKGYGSFFVGTFSFLKSTHIMSFPFFLGITMISDNEMASSTSCINPTAICLYHA